jgi:hypothetical protein
MQDHASNTQAHAFQGPVTHNRAKKLHQELNSFLTKIYFKTYDKVMPPKCSTLVVLRYIDEEDGTTKLAEEVYNSKQSD